MTDKPYVGEFRWQGEPQNSPIEMWDGKGWVLTEPQGPTDEDIYEWGNSVFLPSLSQSERLSYPITDKDLRVITRAVLARWGR
jgi:hypothetical protein